MNLPRRKFLQKTFVGFLSMCLLPPTYSLLKRFGDSAFSVNNLFSQLSFKKTLFSHINVIEKFGYEDNNSEELNNTGHILYANETVCIPGINNFIGGEKEGFVIVYHKTLNGFQRVLTLNRWELLALQKMLTCLKIEQGISDPKQLHAFLIPVFKTGHHYSQKNIIEGNCSSRFGYYTDNGYCSIRILAKGNRMKVNTSLRNHRKIETFQNSFEIPNLV